MISTFHIHAIVGGAPGLRTEHFLLPVSSVVGWSIGIGILGIHTTLEDSEWGYLFVD